MSPAFSCDTKLSSKQFQILLIALEKVNFFDEDESALEDVVTSIYQKPRKMLSEADECFISAVDNLQKELIYEQWTCEELTTKLQERDMQEEFVNQFLKFYKNENEHIRENIINQCSSGDTLQRVKWRIDVVTSSKDKSEIQEPIATLELNMANVIGKKKQTQFSMTRKETRNLLQELDSIRDQINGFMAQSSPTDSPRNSTVKQP